MLGVLTQCGDVVLHPRLRVEVVNKGGQPLDSSGRGRVRRRVHIAKVAKVRYGVNFSWRGGRGEPNALATAPPWGCLARFLLRLTASWSNYMRTISVIFGCKSLWLQRNGPIPIINTGDAVNRRSAEGLGSVIFRIEGWHGPCFGVWLS